MEGDELVAVGMTSSIGIERKPHPTLKFVRKYHHQIEPRNRIYIQSKTSTSRESKRGISLALFTLHTVQQPLLLIKKVENSKNGFKVPPVLPLTYYTSHFFVPLSLFLSLVVGEIFRLLYLLVCVLSSIL